MAVGRRWDLFAAHNDGNFTAHTKRSLTTTGATVLNAGGATFILTGAFTAVVGARCKITDSGGGGTGKSAYCVITGPGTSSTSFSVIPLQSDQDSAGVLGLSFASGAAITIDLETPMTALVLPIDLSEAPEDSYSFVVLANGYLTNNSTSGASEAWLRLCLPCDPLTGDKYSQARITQSTGSHVGCYNYTGGMYLTLTGGQRYEIHLQFASDIANQQARMNHPRMVAIRVDPTLAYVAGDGKTAEASDTSETFQDYLSIGAGDIAPGDYLLLGAWSIQYDVAATYGAVAEIINDRTVPTPNETYALEDWSPISGTDWCPAGVVGKVTIVADNDIKLKFKRRSGVGSGTAKIRHALLALVPISGLAVADVESFSDDGFQSKSNTSGFEPAYTSDPVDVEAGTYVEIVSAAFLSGAVFQARPNFAIGGTARGLHAWTSSLAAFPTFWIHRNKRQPASTTNAIEVDVASGSVSVERPYFTWLRETEPVEPLPQDEIAICAEVEYGITPKYGWTNVTGQRYQITLSGVDIVVRVIETGRIYVEKATEAETHGIASTWHFDRATKVLTVTFRVGVNPATDGIYPVVVGANLFARGHADVLIAGQWRPYASRLKSAPSISQALDASDGRFNASTSLGAIEIAAGTDYDDLLVQRQWKGHRVRIWRGFPLRSADRQDFELIGDYLAANPSLTIDEDGGTLKLDLLDRALILQKPVTETLQTVKEGYNPAIDRDGQVIPVVYGKVLGVPFYRTTADEVIGTGNYNTYKGCAHAIKDVTAVRISSEIDAAPINLSTQVTKDATRLNAGTIRVRNDVWPDDGALAQPGDVVWVDIVGRVSGGTDSTQAALVKPGEIAKDLLQAYGGLVDADLLGSTFRRMDRPAEGRMPYRPQRQSGVLVPQVVEVGLVIGEGLSIADALDELCGSVNAYWFTSRQARFGLDIPDLDAHNLVPNPSFEEGSTSSVYLWSAMGSATISVNTTNFYLGARSMQIATGASNPNARAVCGFVVPTDGPYGVRLLIKSISGDTDAFKVGWLGPDGEEILSDAFAISTTEWTPVSTAFEVTRGMVGSTTLRLYPANGSNTATTVVVDMVECYRLCAVLDEDDSVPIDVSFEPDNFYVVSATLEVDLRTNLKSTFSLNDSEVYGLSSSEPEGKHLIQSSSRLAMPQALLPEAYSAAGVVASAVSYWGRARHRLGIIAQQQTRLALVGERFMHRANPRIPEAPDSYPFWRIVGVDFQDQENALDLTLIGLRQADPIVDRNKRT